MHESVLSKAEVRLLYTLLSPRYVYDAAREHGGGDPVLGDEAAYREIRGMVRTIMTGALRRERRHGTNENRIREEVRLALEALGYGQRWSLVVPVTSSWRSLATKLWDRPEAIVSSSMVQVGGTEYQKVVRAYIRSLASVIHEHMFLNRAFLDGRIWTRKQTAIMVHVEPALDDVRPLTVIAHDCTDREMARRLKHEYARTVRVQQHPLVTAGQHLLAEWCQEGFLVSPASAMISACGVFRGMEHRGLLDPEPSLIPGNGVPISLGIGRIEEGRVKHVLKFDHRVLDASAGAFIHGYLEKEVPTRCQQESG